MLRARLLALALLLLAPIGVARACACVRGSTADDLRRAEAVFLGLPIAFRPSLREPLAVEVTRFRVSRVWKGDVGAEAELAMAWRIPCVGSFRDDGRHVVVFAWRDARGRLTTDRCAGTVRLTDPATRLVGVPGRYALTTDSLAEMADAEFAVLDSFPEVLAMDRRLRAELGPGRAPSGPAPPDVWPMLVGWVTFSLGVTGAVVLAQRSR